MHYVFWYAKDKEKVKSNHLYIDQVPGEEGAKEYKRVELKDGTIFPISKFLINGKANLPSGARIFATGGLVSSGGKGEDIKLEYFGKKYTLRCGQGRHWKVGEEGIKKLWEKGRLLRQEGLRIYKSYLDDFPYKRINNVWTDTRGENQNGLCGSNFI